MTEQYIQAAVVDHPVPDILEVLVVPRAVVAHPEVVVVVVVQQYWL